jgi:hypothetical protein
MFDDAFYWIFCAVIVAVVVIKSGKKPKTQGTLRAYLIGAVLGALASFGIGFLVEHTNPIDILLLKKAADIYSVFLISIAYGMLLRVLLWVITGAKPPTSQPPQAI